MAIVSSKKPVWMTLAAALLLHTILISVQTNHRIDTSFVRTWLLDSLSPGEKLVDRTLHGTGSIWERYFALIGVYDENKRLHAQLDALQLQMATEHEDVLEAERLRQYVGLDDSRLGKTVIARVIGRDPTQSRQSITIDKGRTEGIQPDAAVMTAKGIVGRVVYAGNYSAVVQLVVDSQAGVGVLVLPNRRIGIIKGNGTGDLDLDYIDDDSDLKIGDLLITSGDDRIYPKGFPVGVISSIEPPRHNVFKTVRIKPSADLGRLEEVLCVVDKPKSIQGDTADRLAGPTP